MESNELKHPAHERKIETVFGRVELNRAGYGNQGCKSLHPLDAELNLPPRDLFIGATAKSSRRSGKELF